MDIVNIEKNHCGLEQIGEASWRRKQWGWTMKNEGAVEGERKVVGTRAEDVNKNSK